MIRLTILALVLSMLSGTLGAGLAACRNWTMGPGTEADTAPSAPPDAAANPAAEQVNTPPSESERLWAALERERAARRAAERRPERMAQPQAAHARPEPQPAIPVATAEPARNEAAPIRIPAGTAVAVRTAAAVTSGTAQVEDTVPATTAEEITVNGRTAIPAGSRMIGSVTAIERAGRMSGSDRITIRFHTLVYDSVETSLKTAPVIRAGPGQSSQNATRIGGAAVGAILGAVLRGRRGAAIGGAIGTAGGSTAAAAEHAAPAVLEAGETLTLRTTRPATVETR